jgi:hypothetical protein
MLTARDRDARRGRAVLADFAGSRSEKMLWRWDGSSWARIMIPVTSLCKEAGHSRHHSEVHGQGIRAIRLKVAAYLAASRRVLLDLL